MITQEEAKEIASKHISAIILSNIYYIGETPHQSWNLYNAPDNCIFIGIRNHLVKNSIIGNSVAIALNKIDGSIKYFGSAWDEG